MVMILSLNIQLYAILSCRLQIVVKTGWVLYMAIKTQNIFI